MMAQSYWIVGPGRMGLSLGWVLARHAEVREVVFVGRRHAPPDHPVFQSRRARYHEGLPGAPRAATCVLLAVADGVIGDAARELAAQGRPGADCVALHLSGARPARVLDELARLGYAIGSLHPLQTVADAAAAPDRLRGAFFTFEGEAAARGAAGAIVASASGRLLEVHAADKARYHAACVFASNYLVACAAVATRLLAEAVGTTEEEAARALQPLCGGAVANLAELGLPRALTGPVARGDLGTVRGHLETLAGAERELYVRLGLEALAVSRRQGLGEEAAARIEAELRSWMAGGTAGS